MSNHSELHRCRNGGGTGGMCPPQVFAKVNAHYTRIVEERPLYKGVVAAV